MPKRPPPVELCGAGFAAGAPKELPRPAAGLPKVDVLAVLALLPPKRELPVDPDVFELDAPNKPPDVFVAPAVLPPVFPKRPPEEGAPAAAVLDAPNKPPDPVVVLLLVVVVAPNPVPAGLLPNPPALLAFVPPSENVEPLLPPKLGVVVVLLLVLEDPNRKLAGLF